MPFTATASRKTRRGTPCGKSARRWTRWAGRRSSVFRCPSCAIPAPPRRLELAPYVVVKNEPAPGFTRDQGYDAGADIKFGITSNITVDATINPDFGQV